MSTIPATNPVPTDPASLTPSPDAVHEGHTMMTLNAEVLRYDADVQPRLALSDTHIRAYATLLQEGHQLGTIVVFQDSLDSYLADGYPVWARWFLALVAILMVAAAAVVVFLLPAWLPTPSPPPPLDEATFKTATVLVPVMRGSWLEGYHETGQYCRVLLTDDFTLVRSVPPNLVVLYEPWQARPDFCPPGTLVLADVATQGWAQIVRMGVALVCINQRPR